MGQITMWKNTMNKKLNLLILLLTLAMLSLGCKYIVVPEDLIAKATFSEGWNAVVTDISQTQGGDLHLDITIQNTTGAWSSMNAVVGKPATLTSGSKTSWNGWISSSARSSDARLHHRDQVHSKNTTPVCGM
jgi:hypothetical protein